MGSRKMNLFSRKSQGKGIAGKKKGGGVDVIGPGEAMAGLGVLT